MSLRLSSLRHALGLATLLGLSINASAASKSVDSQEAPERDYRLFVGLNVEVSKNEQYSLIEGYVRNRVRTDAFPGLIALRNVDNMRFTHAPKLSRNSLVVDNLSTKKITSTAKAARDAMRNQQSMHAFQDHQSFMMQRELSQFVAEAEAEGVTDADLLAAQIAQKQSEIADFARMTDKMTAPDSITESIDNSTKEEQKDVPTALLITANVSARTPVTDAYLVGVARISTEESVGQDVIFFDRIARLDQKPRQIKIVKEGLPGKFEVLDVKIHIYRNGQELVTDKSEKQFALTREEAFEYLALERVSRNRGKSLAPEPAWSLAPAELFSSAKADAFDFPMTVEVDETGKVTQIDPNIIVPENVAALITELPFFPGLEDGVAVSSTAQVNLASFFR